MNISIDNTLHQIMMAYGAAVSTLQQLVEENARLKQELAEARKGVAPQDNHKALAEMPAKAP